LPESYTLKAITHSNSQNHISPSTSKRSDYDGGILLPEKKATLEDCELNNDGSGNIVIIGEPGVGKTAIAEGLAVRMAAGDVPESLKGKELVSLDLGLLVGQGSLLAGPVGLVTGAVGGTVIGSLIDILNFGVGEEFIAQVSKELTPGKCAVIAELAETWTTPLDTRMEAVGGTVLRTRRADFEDEQIAKELAADKADWEELKAEYAQASAEAKAKLQAKVNEAKANLVAAEKRLEGKVATLDKEMKAKVAAMEEQVANARTDAQAKIKQRIAALRSDYQSRSEKLKRAATLAKEALAA
jgi:hypothetical protein